MTNNAMIAKITKSIFVRTTFPARHAWPEAPIVVAWLRHPHRHLFHVEVHFSVSHDDREKEFFMLQRELEKYIVAAGWRDGELGSMSCEMLAGDVLLAFRSYGAFAAMVSEDDENGAWVRVEETP